MTDFFEVKKFTGLDGLMLFLGGLGSGLALWFFVSMLRKFDDSGVIFNLLLGAIFGVMCSMLVTGWWIFSYNPIVGGG